MPNCPYCEIQLAMCEDGGICQQCLRIFKPMTLATMPGYDEGEVKAQLELFIMLISAGVLRGGKNSVQILDDGIIIQNHGKDY